MLYLIKIKENEKINTNTLLFIISGLNAKNQIINPGPTVYYLVSPDGYTIRIGLWVFDVNPPAYQYNYNILIPQGY